MIVNAHVPEYPHQHSKPTPRIERAYRYVPANLEVVHLRQAEQIVY